MEFCGAGIPKSPENEGDVKLESNEREQKLRVAQEALEECRKIHTMTGWEQIPLKDVADALGIAKEEVQTGFDLLVEEHIIGDDGDRDHLNFRDVDGLLVVVIQLLESEKESKEKEEDEEEPIQVEERE